MNSLVCEQCGGMKGLWTMREPIHGERVSFCEDCAYLKRCHHCDGEQGTHYILVNEATQRRIAVCDACMERHYTTAKPRSS